LFSNPNLLHNPLSKTCISKMEFILRKYIAIFLTGFILLFSVASYALPFTIVPMPGTTLPTSVVVGSTVQAYYIVINNTGSTRTNNYVRFLPPNVTQATSGNTCATVFTLAPSGQPGDSCTLELTVSGDVDSNDPEQTHHLFVCFPGGLTCAGTQYPLNVTVSTAPPPKPTLLSITITPLNPTIFLNSTQQFTATGNYSDGSTANITNTVTWTSSAPLVATISSTGLARGITVGTTNITASLNGITSAVDVATVSKQIVSIAITPTTASLQISLTQQFTAIATYTDSTTADITSSATWTSSNPSIATINSSGLATGVTGGVPNTTNITASSQSITSNTAVINVQIFLYLNSSSNNSIIACNTSGISVTNCNGGSFSAYDPVSPGVNRAHNQLFNVTTGTVGIGQFLVELITCPITGTAVMIGSCLPSLVFNVNFGFNNPRELILDNNNIFAYVPNAGNNTVSTCRISGTTFSGCSATSVSGNPNGVALNPANTILYVAAPGAGVFNCAIGVTGTLTCQNAGYTGTPGGVAIDPTNTYAYVGDENNQISVCLIGSNGNFTSCTVQSATTINNVQSLAIDPPGQDLFIVDGSGRLYGCPITNNGTTVAVCSNISSNNIIINPSGISTG
jgi:hypothetical protein